MPINVDLGAGGVNVYRYAGYNPINNVDPSGLIDWDDDSPAADKNYASSLTTRDPANIRAAQKFYSFELNFVPGLNAVQGLHQAISGCDVLTGDSLNGLQRGLGALQAAGPLLHGPGALVGIGHDLLADVKTVGSIEYHHILPNAVEFRRFWQYAKINIHEFTVPLEEGFHQNVIHGGPGEGGAWNAEWREFFSNGPKSQFEVFKFADDLKVKYGIDKIKEVRYPYIYRLKKFGGF